MNTKAYKVSELRRIIKESADEFKPVKGKNVDSDNRKNNDKAYKDMSNDTKKFDGGAREKGKKLDYPHTDNKGMENIAYDNINDDFKKRVKSQIKGYTSVDNEKLHKDDDYGNAEHNDISGMEEKDKALRNGKITAKEIGLTSRQIPRDAFDKLSDSVFESKLVKLKFKNTSFISEGHMINKIPDDFKVEGRRFIMEDKNDHQYLVEWHTESEPKVLDKNRLSEQKNRIKELFSYKRGESMTNNSMRVNEDKNISLMINKTRSLLK